MPFQPGNQESKKGNHKRPKIITQQLIAALNETDASNITKMRRVVEALIEKATGGDVQAIKEITDRIEGKVPQGIEGPEEGSPVKMVIEWAKTQSSE